MISELAPLIKAPQLIKVLTISPGIVDQMSDRSHRHVITDEKFDWEGWEIVGRIPPHDVLVVREAETGELAKVSALTYLDARQWQLMVEKEGTGLLAAVRAEAHKQARAELRAIPQLFQAMTASADPDREASRCSDRDHDLRLIDDKLIAVPFVPFAVRCGKTDFAVTAPGQARWTRHGSLEIRSGGGRHILSSDRIELIG